MKYALTAGLIMALASIALWAIIDKLGLSSISGNTLTIFTAFAFFLVSYLASSRSSDDITEISDDRENKRSNYIDRRYAIALLSLMYLFNWFILLQIYDSFRNVFELLVKNELAVITDRGFQQFQLFLSGFCFMFWTIPMIILVGRWIYKKCNGFQFSASIGSLILSIGIYSVIYIVAQPGGLQQSLGIIQLSVGADANPFVSANVVFIAFLIMTLIGGSLLVALLPWVPSVILRRTLSAIRRNYIFRSNV